MSSKPPTGRPNRLAREASPYLRQHQYNPVDWYPWGAEALEAAKRENKPIFLSVGYSTCYWCHVMERQCFENESIAAEMNKRFINIKVDREERPDIDQLYMLAVQVLTRSGGWPMSVFLTPELSPFYAGTYFPPDERYGRISFPRLLASLEDAWINRRPEILKTGAQLIDILTTLSLPKVPKQPVTLDKAWVGRALVESTADYDEKLGGFGAAPKFPRETLLELMLEVGLADQTGTTPARPMLHNTLLQMARGGMRDQLGGGFHRYSTDRQWLVPHFEIMLYDNAMLLPLYARAGQWLADMELTNVAMEVGDFLLREMRHPAGPFFTAIDAEVDGREGLNYLWTLDEVRALLSADQSEQFAKAYGLDRGPNFADPHAADHGESASPKSSILFRAIPTQPGPIEAQISDARRTLKTARDQRKQPLLDDKILTHWNGLAIAGLAEAGKTLSRDDFITAAETAATWLLTHHAQTGGRFVRSSRDGTLGPPAILDDYAAMGWACWQLFRATGKPEWRAHAEDFANDIASRFASQKGSESGSFFLTELGQSDIPVRQKVATDSPLPSGNAMAIRLLIALGRQPAARTALRELAGWVEDHQAGASSMVLAVWELAETITSGPADPALQSPISPAEQAQQAVNVRVERVGDRGLRATLFVADGYHLTAADDVSRGLGLIGLSLEIPGATVDYPASQPLNATGSPGGPGLSAFGGEVVLMAQFAENPPPLVMATLRYQVCSDDACLPPVVQRLELRLSTDE